MKLSQITLNTAIFVTFLCSKAGMAGTDDFLHPPSAVWTVVGEPRTQGSSIAAIPGGYIVAGNEAPVPTAAGGCPDICIWATLTRLNLSGAVTRATNFHWVAWHNRASQVIPILNGGGALDGFVFAGDKHYFFTEENGHIWGGPWVWLVKTDLNLVLQWDEQVGVVSHGSQAAALARAGSGFLVGGSDLFLAGSGSWAWLGAFDASGNLTWNPPPMYGRAPVNAIEPAGDGGYVLGTDEGLVKVNASYEVEWQAGGGSAGTNYHPDAYYAVKRTSGGDFIAVGRRAIVVSSNSPAPLAASGSSVIAPPNVGFPDWTYGDLVLSKFSSSGTPIWSRVYGDGGSGAEIGNDLVLAPDGSIVIVGSIKSRGFYTTTDLWVLKTDANGEMNTANEWDLSLGGTESDYGNSITIAPEDGHYVVAGTAKVAGTNRMWILKLRNDLHSPVPAFTFTPASPMFRDQPITFDASPSTAPGSTMTSYAWDFGDGTTGTGVTALHTYHSNGFYQVILTVANADGVVRSATNEIEVIGLTVQWERLFGADDRDVAPSMVEARDGGFVITGTASEDLWLFKTDRRGRRVWEKILNNGFNGTQDGFAVIRAHDSGYIVAGHDYHYQMSYWYDDAWLLKVDEDGNLAWPIQSFGEPTVNEQFLSVAATRDGGYIFSGYAPTNGLPSPWLVKTDGEGHQIWARHCETPNTRWGSRVTQAADNGFVTIAEANGYASWVIKTDADGTPMWTNQLGHYEIAYWIAPRNPPSSGFVLVGRLNKDISMRFLSPEGAVTDLQTWTGMTTMQDTDTGHSAAPTPDGGYLVVGSVGLRPGSIYTQLRNDVALIKTDADGNTQWVEFMPGTTNLNEVGLAAVALTNNSYVVLGRRETGTARVWLFKLAYNHPPVPEVQVLTNVGPVGEFFTFDGAASTDRDGTVVLHEWDFGDGQTAEGAVATHAYTNSGACVVRFTAVDDEDAERSLTFTNFVTGVRISTPDTRFDILGYSITNCPSCDPTNYPRTGVPLRVDWANARGFRLNATSTSSTTRAFRITFPDPIPTGLTLYQMPNWTVVSYTVIDKHTIQLQVHTGSGSVNLAFVLAATAPLPTITTIQLPNASRVSLTFSTVAGFLYRVQRTLQLAPAGWADVTHALTVGDPATLDTISGTGAAATVFVELPAENSAFFRVTMERATP